MPALEIIKKPTVYTGRQMGSRAPFERLIETFCTFIPLNVSYYGSPCKTRFAARIAKLLSRVVHCGQENWRYRESIIFVAVINA